MANADGTTWIRRFWVRIPGAGQLALAQSVERRNKRLITPSSSRNLSHKIQKRRLELHQDTTFVANADGTTSTPEVPGSNPGRGATRASSKDRVPASNVSSIIVATFDPRPLLQTIFRRMPAELHPVTILRFVISRRRSNFQKSVFKLDSQRMPTELHPFTILRFVIPRRC